MIVGKWTYILDAQPKDGERVLVCWGLVSTSGGEGIYFGKYDSESRRFSIEGSNHKVVCEYWSKVYYPIIKGTRSYDKLQEVYEAYKKETT